MSEECTGKLIKQENVVISSCSETVKPTCKNTNSGFKRKLGKKILDFSMNLIQFHDLEIDKKTGVNNEWTASLAERFDTWHKVY